MSSNSATALVTQQSVKAYVDTQVTAQDLDFVGDTGTGSVDLDSQSLDIEGTANEIETVAANQKITIGLPDYVTSSNLNVTGITTNVQLKIGTAGQTLVGITTILYEDNMASNSVAALATQQSIKAYVDTQVTAQDLDFQAGSGGALAIDLDSETLEIAGTANEITTVGAGNSVTIALPDDVTIGQDLTVTRDLGVTRNLSATGNLTVGAGGTVITTVVGAAASIGIGDASPSYMLDVAGAINSQTDVKVNGVSVSDQALNDAVAMAIALG